MSDGDLRDTSTRSQIPIPRSLFNTFGRLTYPPVIDIVQFARVVSRLTDALFDSTAGRVDGADTSGGAVDDADLTAEDGCDWVRITARAPKNIAEATAS